MSSSFTTSFSLFKSTGAGTNLSTLLFELPKLLGNLIQFSNINLSASDFNLAKSVFLAKSDISTPVAFFKSAFVT